ncbi:MAG TPA: DUF2285 domain-containing protein [Allosphingosinicella sp.]|jgi:hypothetical protein
MAGDENLAIDWRDGAAYSPLLAADRSIIAWEWLRRDPGYRRAARGPLGGRASGEAGSAAAWGLEAFEDPDRMAPDARPLWGRDVHPAVLAAVAAEEGGSADSFDPGALGELATLLRAKGGIEHLLLSDGLRAIRVDIVAGSVAEGPVRLRYLLAGLASAEPPLLTLRRLIHVCRVRRFSRSLHPREARARRWLLMLRARDALAAGAEQREIAAILLSPSAREARWRSDASSLRSQAQRLVRGARRMAAGGYRALLR